MKDVFRGEKKRKKKGNPVNTRFIIFTAAVMMMFGVLVYGLFDLQLVKGTEYAERTDSLSIKSIAIKGSRGMITDVNSVVLARSEKAYNVTFYRENLDWDYPTRMLLEAIEIIERHGGAITLTSPLVRNEETGVWEFNFGSGISETAWNTRRDYFYENNYLKKSLSTAADCFDRLRQRYGFTPLEDGDYLLALNAAGESVILDPAALMDVTVSEETDEEGEVVTRTIRTLNLNRISQLNEQTNDEKQKIAEHYKVDEATVLKVLSINTSMQDNAYNSLPISIAEDVSYETVSEIEGRSMSMPWVGVSMGDKRVYPNGSLAATIIGYTGKIQNAAYYYSDLKPAGYAMNDTIGQAGVEASMENWLTANILERQGSRVVETDPSGKVTRVLSYDPPTDGNTVKLAINAEYQKVAERYIKENVAQTRAVQEEKMRDPQWLEANKDKIESRDWEEYPLKLATTGVLIVLDVKTGNILALAQYPNYDLNAMVRGGEAAQQIVQDERGLLMNYAIQTRAEPGSIFKMVTGLAALTNGVLTPEEEISDRGRFMNYTNSEKDAPKCWTNYPSQHQDLNISRGLTKSCNYFFYTLASRLYDMDNTERLYKYAAQMGLTSKTGIDLPGELRSIVGSQTNLYDQTVSLREQVTSTPIIVANTIKRHLINYGASYGIQYDEARLDRCIKQLMDMAVNTGSGSWVVNARPIFMNELGMTRNMVMQAALMNDLWNYLNTIKWGGSQEIQMGIGQSITLLTPIAVVRYVGALSDSATVWNPQLIDSIVSPEGEILSQRSATVFNTLDSARPSMPYILKGMEGVVDEGGTANRYFRKWKYYDVITEVMCGKTGTSQVTIGGIKLDLENNAWFVSLCPRDNPEIAVVSFIPNGYAGAHCAPAARDFIGFYLDEKAKVDETISLPGGNSLAP